MCSVISFTIVLIFDSLQILNVKLCYSELAPSKSISTPHFIVNVLFLSVVTTNISIGLGFWETPNTFYLLRYNAVN